VLDGTEILAVIVSKRSFATVGEVVLALNVLIFSIAAALLGVEAALYSTLTYFAGSKTIDYVLHGIEAYHGVLIVSAKFGEIRQAILSDLGRGCTTLVGRQRRLLRQLPRDSLLRSDAFGSHAARGDRSREGRECLLRHLAGAGGQRRRRQKTGRVALKRGRCIKTPVADAPGSPSLSIVGNALRGVPSEMRIARLIKG
jgi:hypothetical protein